MKLIDTKPGRVPAIESNDEQIVFVMPISLRDQENRTLTIRCERRGDIYLSIPTPRTAE